MFYCCFCRKTCPRLCNNFEVVDLIDQDRMPSKEKITCSDGVVNLLFLICHLGFIGLQFLIIVDLMSNRDAQVFDVSVIIFDGANAEQIKAKNYGAFWHGFTSCVVMLVSSLLSMGGGSTSLKSKFNRLLKMTPLADTIYMFILGAKPLGSSFSNMFATLTEKIPITFLNIYLAMHLWHGNHLDRVDPTNNGHEMAIYKYIWASFGMSVLSICISIAEFEAGEAMDFEIADISQFSFYYIFLILYRFMELGSRLILMACVGSTFMSVVLVFDVFAMALGSLGFWAGLILSPWLVAVQFMPFTTIDIWRTRDYLPQHWALKLFEAIVLISFASVVHYSKGEAVTNNEKLQGIISIMGERQRQMIFVAIGMFLMQYVCLFIVLKIGHEHYARSVPSPSEECSSLFKAIRRETKCCIKTICCCFFPDPNRKKKRRNKKGAAKVHVMEQVEDLEAANKTTGSSKKADDIKVIDYKSDEELRTAENTQDQFAALLKGDNASMKKLDMDGEKPKRRRTRSLKRKGTMML